MGNSVLRSHLLRLSAASLAIAGVAAVAWPTAPVNAISFDFGGSRNDYLRCIREVKATEIPEADIAAACAAVLRPRDFARCVTRISSGTEVAATDALNSCRRVRRPQELSTCVVDILDTGEEADPKEVLDSCRRSLLPVRYSQCVVALQTETELPIADSLTTCIAANNRPRNVLPSFVPSGQETPVTPGTQTPITPPPPPPPITPVMPATPIPGPAQPPVQPSPLPGPQNPVPTTP
jgi:hypothetical protein